MPVGVDGSGLLTADDELDRVGMPEAEAQQALADNLLTPRNDPAMDRTGGQPRTPPRHQGGICFETKFGIP